MYRSPLEQLMSRVIPEPNTGCWFWIGAIHNPSGYGRLGIGGRNGRDVYAHRLSYELYRGSIPSGFVVCHKCDDPICVNPDHLFLGTHRDNSNDKCQKGRQLYGERNPRAKLSYSSVKLIRVLYSEGLTQRYLADRFGVARETIGQIVRGERWRCEL
jgi:DNA-binding XRE family transcriptional regulator